MPDALTLSITSRSDELGRACRWFEESLVAAKVAESARWDLLLVFEEIVANVIVHAYVGRDDGPVEISVEFADRAVQLVVRDEGPSFDPLAQPEPDLSATGPRQVGGLGVHLVRSLCNEVRYRRSGESNILTVRKDLN